MQRGSDTTGAQGGILFVSTKPSFETAKECMLQQQQLCQTLHGFLVQFPCLQQALLESVRRVGDRSESLLHVATFNEAYLSIDTEQCVIVLASSPFTYFAHACRARHYLSCNLTAVGLGR